MAYINLIKQPEWIFVSLYIYIHTFLHILIKCYFPKIKFITETYGFSGEKLPYAWVFPCKFFAFQTIRRNAGNHQRLRQYAIRLRIQLKMRVKSHAYKLLSIDTNTYTNTIRVTWQMWPILKRKTNMAWEQRGHGKSYM